MTFHCSMAILRQHLQAYGVVTQSFPVSRSHLLLGMVLQAERDAPVDVQVGPVLYEDAPQELRSRMWMALLNDPNLTGYLSEERVGPLHVQTDLATSTGRALIVCKEGGANIWFAS